jgi:hypothetical protein
VCVCVCSCLQIHILVSGSGVYLYASISGISFFWGRRGDCLYCFAVCASSCISIKDWIFLFLSVVLQILCACVCVSISFLLRFNMETDLMWMDT